MLPQIGMMMSLPPALAAALTSMCTWSLHQATGSQGGSHSFSGLRFDWVWCVPSAGSLAFVTFAIALLSSTTCFSFVATPAVSAPYFGALPCILGLAYLSRIGFTVSLDPGLRAGLTRAAKAVTVAFHGVVVGVDRLRGAAGLTQFQHMAGSNTSVIRSHGGF